jgi:hypothetical protein
MRRGALILAAIIGVFSFATAACTAGGAEEISRSPTPAATTVLLSAVRAPQPEVQPKVAVAGRLISERPLAELSPLADRLAREQGDPIGVAVLDVRSGAMYTLNPDKEFELASVSKLPIMMTLLNQAHAENRTLTPTESDLLASMITLSDNPSADVVFEEVGGATGLTEYLESIGITGADISPSDWGEAEMSAPDAVLLMASLVGGQALDPAATKLAMSLLENVEPDHAWGVVAGAGDVEHGVKNGWYPEPEGWVMNSLGYAMTPAGTPDYVIAIFSDHQLWFSDAIAQIESIASIIRLAFRSGG